MNTHRPIEWDDWMRDRLGAGYEPLRQLALSTTKIDVISIAADLEQQWKAMVVTS